jgi:hypothetical protein
MCDILGNGSDGRVIGNISRTCFASISPLIFVPRENESNSVALVSAFEAQTKSVSSPGEPLSSSAPAEAMDHLTPCTKGRTGRVTPTALPIARDSHGARRNIVREFIAAE